MTEIFTLSEFVFPYTDYRFPGQNSDEEILFVVRENEVIHLFRLSLVFGMGVAILMAGWLVGWFLQANLGWGVPVGFGLITVIAAAITMILGWWWQQQLWLKSICIVTTKRLTKFVYTTPVNRHTLSLPLEMIVDTGSYTKGFLQALFKLGTFTARSSASSSGLATDASDRVNKKYFYIENVAIAEDLQQYINKLLSVFRNHQGNLQDFRPFIPHLKGKERERFMQEHPEYWS
ncbi:MAG TPA: hypothetical protein DEP87_00910 [Candidatus Pacebacteria bacterium]|nr:hypothetical protein [Candidatus Paceibacterota bacterium]